jgi:two-component system, chemotaxis family, sensor kinase CheA
MNRHREAFREEAYELLSELETALLELEEKPGDKELIGRVFRAMHTIKGSGAMFGFDDVATFTHEVETVYDQVRDGKIAVDKILIDLTLKARDLVQKMVDGATADKSESARIIESFRSLLINEPPAEEESSLERKPEANPPDKIKIESEDSSTEVLYRIQFRPDASLFAKGMNPVLLLNELKGLGECIVVARTDAVPVLKDMDPESNYLYWDIVMGTGKGINAIRDVFIFVEDDCELKIDVIDNQGGLDGSVYKRLGEILLEKGDVTLEDLQRALANQKPIGEILAEAGAVNRCAVESALAEQQQVKKSLKRKQEAAASSSIRVAADKLDILVDLVGELVTVQASLSQKASIQKDPQLTAIAEQVERLTGELRDNTMSIRMLPIGTSFSNLKRLVRDLSNELGKEVIIITEGGETELDKTVIERLNDPLVHVIRNCIDHGIEAPDVREASGKPRKGTVSLSALHSGAHVLIKISDDGEGLEPGVIRKKAIEKGLINTDDILSESELFAQIFTPGFSTANHLTDVSGRGVGMDVVKRSIEALRGSIEVESKKGSGTTITLKLPLTLAIIDGLLVELGKEHFVMPLAAVEECIELKRKDATKTNGRHIVNVRGQMIPYVLLRELFKIREEPPEIQQIAIAEMDGGSIGFVVDRVIGEHQTVIKTLGKVYGNAKEFSGATLLADGSVALILDMHGVLQVAEGEQNGRRFR